MRKNQPHNAQQKGAYDIVLTFWSEQERDTYVARHFGHLQINATSDAPHPNNPEERTDPPFGVSLRLSDDEVGEVVVTGYVTYRAEGWVTRWHGRSPHPVKLENASKIDQACHWLTIVTDMSYSDAWRWLTPIQVMLLEQHEAWRQAGGR